MLFLSFQEFLCYHRLMLSDIEQDEEQWIHYQKSYLHFCAAHHLMDNILDASSECKVLGNHKLHEDF